MVLGACPTKFFWYILANLWDILKYLPKIRGGAGKISKGAKYLRYDKTNE